MTSAGFNTFQFVGSHNDNPGSLPSSPVNQQYHNGWSGWKTSDILNGVTPASSGGLGWLTSNPASGTTPPSIITLMIGTNDAANGVSVAQATANLSEIINWSFSQDPGVRFLLATCTPRTDNAAANAWVNTYNAGLPALVAQDQALGDNIGLVDLNTNFPSNGLAEGLHPNDVGYQWMAQQWYNALLSSNQIPETSAVTIALNATLDLNNAQEEIGPLSGAGNVTLGSDTTAKLTVNSTAGNDTTFSGVISGAGSLWKTGPAALTLSGQNTFSGDTRIPAGTLRIGTALALQNSTLDMNAADAGVFDMNGSDATLGGLKGTRDITLAANKTLSIGNNNQATAYSGGLTGNGSLAKIGSWHVDGHRREHL